MGGIGFRGRWVACAVVWAACCSAPVFAESPLQGAGMAADYLGRLVGGLVVVIGLILVLAWILRRLPGAPGPGRHVIEVLAVRPVGTRERLLLVQVGEEQILLGLTPTGIRHLHTLQERVVIPPTQPPAGDFASLLRRVRDKTETR